MRDILQLLDDWRYRFVIFLVTVTLFNPCSARAASGDAIYLKKVYTEDSVKTLDATERTLLGNAVNWTFGSAVGGDLVTANLTGMICSQPIVGTSGTGVYTCEAWELQEGVTDAELLDLDLEYGKDVVSVEANGDNWDVIVHHKDGTLVPGGIYRHDLFTEDAFDSLDLSLMANYHCWRPDVGTPNVVTCTIVAIVTASPEIRANDRAANLEVQLLGKVP